MNKNAIFLLTFMSSFVAHAQFKVIIDSNPEFSSKTAFIYTLDGSKDILEGKQDRKNNSWIFNFPKPYVGMMKVFFPETNSSVNFISENKEIKIKIQSEKDKITKIAFIDDANLLMNNMQSNQEKKMYILPALYQIKEYYQDDSPFGNALEIEILKLSNQSPDTSKFPFVNYYMTNYSKFLEKNASVPQPSLIDIQNFLMNSGQMLESSSLMRPLLVAYLNSASTVSQANVAIAIDELLNKLNLETPRGQTVLSEFIDIFDVYAMDDLKSKYLSEAKNLKCTINDRLSSTITSNANTEIGAKFPDYKFHSATNTTAKGLYGVNANRKVIIFWSSTCSHCEKEIPDILAKYNELKKQNIEVIGLSLDSDKTSYLQKVNALPWINDSELKGWYSSYAETYNIHATPTYFIIDSDNKIIAKPNHAKDVIDYFKL